MAAPPQRWRTPLIVGLAAAAAGLGVGVALTRRGLVGVAIVAGIALVGALVAWGVLVWVVVEPRRLAPPVPAQDLAQLTLKARLEAADARSRLRHDLQHGRLQTLTVAAVIAGAVLGFWQLAQDRSDARAGRRLTEQAQAGERFTQAVTQLGDRQRVEARIIGIYGLAQAATQVRDYNGLVGEVLLTYLNRQPRPGLKPPSTPRLIESAPDVQAALTVLTQYDKDRDGTKDYAWLSDRIDLHDLRLRGANLQGAYLYGANLRVAYLRNAVLSSADLRKADLYRANLTGADLHGANLSGADLARAGLNGANLRGADLSGANLLGAQLIETDLEDADLRGANLSEANIGLGNLLGAKANVSTMWPDGFDPQKEGVKIE